MLQRLAAPKPPGTATCAHSTSPADSAPGGRASVPPSTRSESPFFRRRLRSGAAAPSPRDEHGCPGQRLERILCVPAPGALTDRPWLPAPGTACARAALSSFYPAGTAERAKAALPAAPQRSQSMRVRLRPKAPLHLSPMTPVRATSSIPHHSEGSLVQQRWRTTFWKKKDARQMGIFVRLPPPKVWGLVIAPSL